jgi:hypothetical protein
MRRGSIEVDQRRAKNVGRRTMGKVLVVGCWLLVVFLFFCRLMLSHFRLSHFPFFFLLRQRESIFSKLEQMPSGFEAGIVSEESKAAQNNHRRTQASLIMGHFSPLFTTLGLMPHINATTNDAMQQQQQQQQQQFAPELIRFSAHLAMCFQTLHPTSSDPQQRNEDVPNVQQYDVLIERYVKHLIQRQQYSMVAMYTVSLSESARIKHYAHMLTNIMDHERRSMCISLAIRHFGAAHALQVVDEAVRRIVSNDTVLHFQKGSPAYQQLVNVMNNNYLFAK